MTPFASGVEWGFWGFVVFVMIRIALANRR
jgi:hypothetical protein